jgi:hypothetical protein
MRWVFAFMMIAGPAFAAEPVRLGPYEIRTFDRSAYNQSVTNCDRLAAHPSDPDAVAPGVAQANVKLSKATRACEEAVRRDPENPRLRYQLARTYGYQNRGADAAPHRIAAVNAGYPQSLFVMGYVHVLGQAAPKDVCLGAELIRLSAFAGRFAGQVGFPAYVLDGTFKGCPVTVSKAELVGFLDAAKTNRQGSDFYARLLVDSLRREVDALAEPAKP